MTDHGIPAIINLKGKLKSICYKFLKSADAIVVTVGVFKVAAM
jgi:hypothetical protein